MLSPLISYYINKFFYLQVEYYLQVAKTMIGKKDNLVEWWRDKGMQFPMLRRVAKKYLSCNATSTASERLFSYAGCIVSKKRCSLKPQKVDMITCLAFNIRSQKK